MNKVSVSRSERAPRGDSGRWVLHTSLALCFAAGGGLALVWPQWVAVEGSRTSLQLEEEREQGLQDRMDAVRAMNSRLRDGRNDTRKLFRGVQVHLFPRTVRDLAKQAGAEVLEARVTGAPVPRWRPAFLELEGSATGAAETAQIRPVCVQIVLTGSFDSVYQTIGSLCRREQLFVPDRWQIRPRPDAAGSKQVKAQFAATVFVLETRTEQPQAPSTEQVAEALPVGSRP